MICGLALRFVFPGYFDPLALFHLDHYVYIGMHARGYGMLRYFKGYPRPVAHLLIDWCGRLGVGGLLAPLYVLNFLNAALVGLYVERVTLRRVALPSFIAFAALAYSNPQFYFSLKEDPFAVFAFTMLLAIFHCWESYVATGGRFWLAAAAVLGLLFSFTKESYFISLALFLLIQSYARPSHRRAAVLLLGAMAVSMGCALFLASKVWVLFHGVKPGPADPYYTSLAPRSLWHGFLRIGKHLAVPAVAVAVAGVLIRSYQKQKSLFNIGLSAVLLGAAALVPNAALPNHLEAQYAFLGAYFFLAPLLLMDRLVPDGRNWKIGLAASAVAVYSLAAVEYVRPQHDVRNWLRDQEQTAHNILGGFDRMKTVAKPGSHSLVTGITTAFDPFRAPEFATYEFGPQRFWTVVVPDSVAEAVDINTRLIHASNPARFEVYDDLFVFSMQGALSAAVARPSPAVIDVSLPGPSGGPPR